MDAQIIHDRAVGESITPYGAFLDSQSGFSVTIEVYRVSDGYTWNFTTGAFASGSNTGTCTHKTQGIWTAPSAWSTDDAGTFLVTFVCDELSQKQFQIYEIATTKASASGGSGLTFLQMKERVAKLCGMYDGISTFNTSEFASRIGDWLNDGQEDILSRHEKWFDLRDSSTFTTTKGDDTYSLASTIDTTRIFNMLQLDTPAIMRQISIERMEALVPDPSDYSQDKPLRYAVLGRDSNGYTEVKLYPIPDATYTIYYRGFKLAGAMSSDGDYSDLGPRLQRALILYGRMTAYEHDKNERMALIMERRYGELVHRLKMQEKRMIDRFDSWEDTRLDKGLYPTPSFPYDHPTERDW